MLDPSFSGHPGTSMPRVSSFLSSLPVSRAAMRQKVFHFFREGSTEARGGPSESERERTLGHALRD